MLLSVIIPVLNEIQALPGTLAALQRAAHAARARSVEVEIIAVDGGSTDGTLEWLHAQDGVRTLTSERGRGRQLRHGASLASGESFFFLHADCVLPTKALTAVAAALADASVCGGCFRVSFGAHGSPPLRYVARAINRRSQWGRIATGDQGLFCRRSTYAASGGFPDWPLFEDVKLADSLSACGKFAVLTPHLTISARRWEKQGVLRTTLQMCWLLLLYRLGVPPHRLSRGYRDVRAGSGPT